MGNRVDLDRENDNLDLSPKNTRPFYNDEELEEEDVAEENTEETIEDDGPSEEEIRKETQKEIKKEATDAAIKVVKNNPVVKKYILIATVVFALLFLIVILAIVVAIAGAGVADGGDYEIRCKEVTVIMTDKSDNYRKTGSQTYEFEDYIAGVVAAEVGGFNNIEVYKVIAIAARTYFLTHDGNKCIIESSDRKQVFRDITSQKNTNSLIYQAVEETAGQVLLNAKGKRLAKVEYDAFCTIDVDANYYTLKQQNQKIPRSWADRQSGIAAEWKQGHCEGNHGRGISQWGAYYLASEENYMAGQIIAYYLGIENVVLANSEE